MSRSSAGDPVDQPVSRALPLAELRARIGEELGVSDWIRVDQVRIDSFAEVTGDHQFIHVDPELARHTPFGTTIAHGFLTLSLLPAMGYSAMPIIEGTRLGLNYGLNRLRFVAPVRSGAQVRGRFRLADLAERPDGGIIATWQVTVEIAGESRPALAAEWLTLSYVEAEGARAEAS